LQSSTWESSNTKPA